MAGHFSTSSSAYRGTETVVVVCKCLVVIVSGRGGGCWWLRNKQEHRQDDDVQNEERCKLPLTASLAMPVQWWIRSKEVEMVVLMRRWCGRMMMMMTVLLLALSALHWMGGWRLTSHYCSSSECGGNKRFNKTCNKSASQHELLLVAGVVVASSLVGSSQQGGGGSV